MRSGKFLESIDDNFLTQVIRGPNKERCSASWNKEGFIGDVNVEGSLGCCGQEVVEFRILRAGSRAESKITSLDFRGADSGLFSDHLGRVPWDKTLEGRGAQESYLKDCLFQLLKEWIPVSRKSGRNGRRPAWMST